MSNHRSSSRWDLASGLVSGGLLLPLLATGVYAVGASVPVAIATALAAAISNIPQFSASTGGSDTVSILGPVGPDGGTYPYRIYQYGLALFSGITPSNNFFAVGVPTITGPTLT